MPRPNPRQRPRPRGRLVSWPLYRLLLVITLVPVLLAVLLVGEPDLPEQPTRELSFDGAGAADKAAEVLSQEGSPGPGGAGNAAAADLVSQQLTADGYEVEVDSFAADLPDLENVPMQNVIAFNKGRRPEIVAVIAHRDGVGSGADDNASGTGLLLQLAGELAGTARERGLVFVSTDGGTSGGQGAARFADTWPERDRIVAALVLDSLSAPPDTPVQVEVRADRPRGTSPTLYATARRALLRHTGEPAVTPGWFDQVSGYALPYADREQGPLLGRGVPALTLTAGPPADPQATFESLDPAQLGEVGTAAVNLLAELDSAGTIDQGGPPAVFLGGSVMRGGLAQITLVLLSVPFLACVLDAAARCRRRRIPLGGGLRAFGWRASTWLVALLGLWLLPLLPWDLASGIAVAPLPGETGLKAIGVLLVAAAALLYWGWLIRPRLRPGHRVMGVERTGGLVSGWLGLAFAALLLCAVNPFSLLIVLPAAHAWLWMPQAARAGRRAMLMLAAAGLVGPLLVTLELALGQGLGWGAPRAMLAMTVSGYLSPAISVCLALAAAAGAQVTALALGRYAPARGRKRLYN